MKRWLIGSIPVLIIAALAISVECTTLSGSMPAHDPLLYSHLIVRGTVDSIEYESIPGGQIIEPLSKWPDVMVSIAHVSIKFDGRNWIRSADDHAMTIEEIRNRISAGGFENVAREADLVLVGEVLSGRNRKVIIGDDLETRLQEHRIRILSVLKGK